MVNGADNQLQRIWYGESSLRWLLLPFSWLYAALIAVRRFAYVANIRPVKRLPVPVIIVGNLTAGGTGKTPITVWLARQLAEKSFSPGIVSRGYGGSVGAVPLAVTADSDPGVVGDEAVLMARHFDGPVVVHPDRVQAAELAVARGADVIVSDDGLQHLRLGRDFEIVVLDGERLVGNRMLLPAGPLREPLSRMTRIDQLLLQSESERAEELLQPLSDSPASRFQLNPSAICRLDDSDIRNITEFSGKTVHAVAGIGHPQRFFRMLEAHDIEVVPHPLADHVRITQQDLEFGDDYDVVMTEKDSVKCRWLDTSRCWYVPVEVTMQEADADRLLDRIVHAIEPGSTNQSV